VIEARKNAYFYAFFKNGKRLTEDKDAQTEIIIEEIKKYKEKIILTGYNSDKLFDSLPEEIKNVTLNKEKICYARELIKIAKAEDIFYNDCSQNLVCGPEYIRLPDAEMSAKFGKSVL
jgi:tRNA A37 threonylcarbamoyladenosine modification protein TsaB